MVPKGNIFLSVFLFVLFCWSADCLLAKLTPDNDLSIKLFG